MENKHFNRKIVKNNSGVYMVMIAEDLVDEWKIEKIFYHEENAKKYIKERSSV